jgi:hypothetical protein
VAARLAERRRAEAAQQAVTAAKQQEEETFKVPSRCLMLAMLPAAAAGCSCSCLRCVLCGFAEQHDLFWPLTACSTVLLLWTPLSINCCRPSSAILASMQGTCAACLACGRSTAKHSCSGTSSPVQAPAHRQQPRRQRRLPPTTAGCCWRPRRRVWMRNSAGKGCKLMHTSLSEM